MNYLITEIFPISLKWGREFHFTKEMIRSKASQ